MGPIIQLSLDQLPTDLQLKLRSVLQDNEEILYCCYRKKDPEEVYLLTKFRVINLSFPIELLARKHSNPSIRDVHYSDIVTIKERKYVGIPFIDPEFFGISVLGQDQEKPIIGFMSNKMDEVYKNFLAILRKKSYEARMKEKIGELKADKSLAERLTELKVLLENDLISHDEYNRLREKILKEIL